MLQKIERAHKASFCNGGHENDPSELLRGVRRLPMNASAQLGNDDSAESQGLNSLTLDQRVKALVDQYSDPKQALQQLLRQPVPDGVPRIFFCSERKEADRFSGTIGCEFAHRPVEGTQFTIPQLFPWREFIWRRTFRLAEISALALMVWSRISIDDLFKRFGRALGQLDVGGSEMVYRPIDELAADIGSITDRLIAAAKSGGMDLRVLPDSNRAWVAEETAWFLDANMPRSFLKMS
jgi:hypothetical protein